MLSNSYNLQLYNNPQRKYLWIFVAEVCVSSSPLRPPFVYTISVCGVKSIIKERELPGGAKKDPLKAFLKMLHFDSEKISVSSCRQVTEGFNLILDRCNKINLFFFLSFFSFFFSSLTFLNPLPLYSRILADNFSLMSI